MKNTDDFHLTIQLTKEQHNDAYKFASKQVNSQKVRQVYLNTLAVYAVKNFLDWLRIETDLESSNSWHSVVRCFHDVADLVIPDLGKLECRPVLPGETIISLPVEVTEDRIAYVGVQFQEQLNEVQLLGFCPAVDPQPEVIKIATLEPIETLIDYIDHLEELCTLSIAPPIEVRAVNLVEAGIVDLSRWLQNFEDSYDKLWQKLDNFINSLEDNESVYFSSGIRSFINTELPGISKEKNIILGQHTMALIVSCQLKNDEKTYILITLYTISSHTILSEQNYLPEGMKIIVFDQFGKVYSEAQAGSENRAIKLQQFRGDPRERFSIQIALGGLSVTEYFII